MNATVLELEPRIAQIQAQMIAFADIVRSPDNTRRIFDPVELQDFPQSIRENGIVEPLIVRPRRLDQCGSYEIVAGEPLLRAAKIGGLVEVRAIVNELTNIQRLDQQLVENAQREDFHPLVEAAGYEQRGQAGASIEEIAKITGKNRTLVGRRLHLLNLTKDAHEVVLRGGMIPKYALQLARLPQSEQPKAFAYLMTDRSDLAEKAVDGEVLKLKDSQTRAKATSDELARFVEHVVMRPLAQAPWSKKDAALVPDAHACNRCAKRTGGANGLLSDEAADKPGRCLNGACYERKSQARLVQLQTKAVAKGESLVLLHRADMYKTSLRHQRCERSEGGRCRLCAEASETQGRGEEEGLGMSAAAFRLTGRGTRGGTHACRRLCRLRFVAVCPISPSGTRCTA